MKIDDLPPETANMIGCMRKTAKWRPEAKDTEGVMFHPRLGLVRAIDAEWEKIGGPDRPNADDLPPQTARLVRSMREAVEQHPESTDEMAVMMTLRHGFVREIDSEWARLDEGCTSR